MDKMILGNINPFIDIWYKDCFFMSLMHLLNPQQKIYLLFNEFYIYQEDPTLNIKNLKYNKDDIFTLLPKIGLNCNYRLKVTDIENEIIKSINNKELIIIAVDPFHEDIRKDAYKKLHIPHCLLVYGYSKEDFYIVEQNYSLSLEYKLERIAKSRLIEAYNGFLEEMKKDSDYIGEDFPIECKIENQFPTYFTIKKSNKNIIIKMENLINFILNSIPILLDSLKILKKQENYLQKLYKKGKEKQLTELIFQINKIIITRKIDDFRFQKLSSNRQKMLIQESIKNWTYLRTIFSKLLFSRKYNEDHFINIILSIRKIFECENEYYTSLLNIDWREIQDGYK